MVVGMFFEHVAGVLNEPDEDPEDVLRTRAKEVAAFFDRP